jgi:hypothetical protein
LGYILANLQLGLRHPEMGGDLKVELKKMFSQGVFE